MSRAVKYRGYVKSKHGIGIFNVKSINFFPLVIELEIEDKVVAFFDFDNVRLLQYTGLKDKNDPPMPVWEGDVILEPISNKYYLVEYDEYGAMFLFREVGTENCLDGYEIDEISSFWMVVGNRFENPKLLEVTE